MKVLQFTILGISIFALVYCAYSFIALKYNVYIGEYPIKTGDTYQIINIWNKDTPIEERDTFIVRIDSTFEGYVIKATTKNGKRYCGPMSMHRFLGNFSTLGPDIINKLETK